MICGTHASQTKVQNCGSRKMKRQGSFAVAHFLKEKKTLEVCAPHYSQTELTQTNATSFSPSVTFPST